MSHSAEYDHEAIHRAAARKGSAKLLKKLIKFHSEPTIEVSPPVVVPPIEVKTLEMSDDPLFIVDRIPRVQDVKRVAMHYFKLSPFDLDSHARTARLSYCRHIAMYVCRHLAGRSFPEIARRMGGRDHTTAIHACNKIHGLVKSDWTVAYDIAQIEGVIIGGFAIEQVR